MEDYSDIEIPAQLRRTREIPEIADVMVNAIRAQDQKPQPPMACRGVLVNMRPMKTSGKLRIEIEVEKEMANDAFEKLGKFVDPAVSRWVALAVIQTEGE